MLRWYPSWFRDAYATQMEADFVDLLLVRPSPRGRVRAWRIGISDFVRSAPTQWLRHWRADASIPNSHIQRMIHMTSLVHDLRIGLRTFLRAPSFALLVVGTLAVGIGGTVAMFSVADGVLFSDLPYQDADRMVVLWNRHASTGADKVQISGPDFVDYRERASSVFEDFVFIHNATDNTVTDGGRAEQVDASYVAANFFTFLGADALLGRTFSSDDNPSTGNAIGDVGPVVISYGLWARRYGSSPDVLGRTIILSGRPVQVVGVMPEDFRLILPYAAGGAMSSGANESADVWRILPEHSFPTLPRSLAIVRVIGRLRPGVALTNAQQEMDGIAAELRAAHRVHQDRGTSIDLIPFHRDVVGHVRAIILSLFGGVAMILLVACANAANLVSVQAANRSREIAVRIALGARRSRVVRQLLTEYSLLSGLGAICGIALAHVLIKTIISLSPANVPLIDQVSIDMRAVGFAVLASAIATIIFGVWPALGAATSAPSEQLTVGSRGGLGHGRRFRQVMVSLEIALSLVLLTAGGLLVRSFTQLQQATLGFNSAEVVTAGVALAHGPFDEDESRINYWQMLRAALDRHPAIQDVGFVSPLPFAGQGAEVPYSNVGGESADWGQFVALVSTATPGYFDAMGAEMIEGRGFRDQDFERANEVAIVDDIVASRLYPGTTALGKVVWLEDVMSRERRPREIIGVVRHIRHSSVTGAERDVIYQLDPAAWNLAIVARAAGGTSSVIPVIRELAANLDSDTPVFDERTLAAYLDDQIAPTRFTMTLATTFGIVALLMAAIGLYGVVAYTVTQRTAELGLRMALGADPSSIVMLVMRTTATVIAIGLGLGLVVALAATRGIQSLLVETSANDPLTFLTTAVLLAMAAALASFVPARRAAALDPVITLKGS